MKIHGVKSLKPFIITICLIAAAIFLVAFFLTTMMVKQ